ncbi:MAG: histidinol-phosphate transaminase [Vicinamibacterales bacterium]|jgi:histidinol-phosphate aminotransferase|nr:histidinol-phosphate transaminase [Acidobacteriota bacterium]MDP7293696.1 histidinol-phosphate transaminase [Vicinamibacterales bacterium]MDP7473101.1 histidinol-phosphate transaminase [Vicinamibacterales bacterium]MDP7671339.1 histidinol-phosphate transaminase [Vicinamibacterales bacterium]HJO38565.1 histidinol-phosphate transaminase [Vicinamibacterales bacterium]|tara:strand:- start:8881 stop:9960 length:1080 start_codon:yes stop_codon:yes gene_type:complete
MTTNAAVERIRQTVRALSGYYDVNPDADVKLDQNENAYDFPEPLKRETFEHAAAVHWERYHEVRPAALLDGLAALTGWPADGLLVGNGSNELLHATILASAAVGGRVLTVQPSFPLYDRLCRLLGAELVGVPLDARLAFDSDLIRREIARTEPSLVVICNPNNPTGSVIAPDGLEAILDDYKGIVLVDEAYYEFSDGSFRAFLDRHDNLLLLRTFSKAMSLAGIRVGYLLGAPTLVGEISKAKLPFTLNPLSCQAALTALRHQPALQSRVDTIVTERERLIAALGKRTAIDVYPSAANFVFIRVPGHGDRTVAGLADRGVLVRRLRGHPLLADSMRVTVGTPEQNDRFLATLDAALADG